MCHGESVRAFPAPDPAKRFDEEVAGYAFGAADAATRIAILPDIYGCGPFYRGLATRYAHKGASVALVDPFDGLGALAESTREAAFARRNKVSDADFVNRFERFIASRNITGVVGFCLGGLYIFELARRQVPSALIGLYGFPQGLPNQDPLAPPFDYLPKVTTPFAMLMGRDDPSVGAAAISKLEAMAPQCPAMDLTIYDGVGHNFLPGLDSGQDLERRVADDALARCDAVLL